MGQNRDYQFHISGLKGIACLMIVQTHYAAVLQFAKPLPASYWLYLFFVVSGYLLGLSRISTAMELVRKSVLRFVRLAVPVFFSYCVIFLIYKTIGFGSAYAGAETTDWFRSFYGDAYSVWDVVLGPVRVLLFGDAALNSPYWVLRDMLLASVLIYGTQYLGGKMPKWSKVILTLFLMAALYAIHKTIPVSCLVGYFVAACLPEPGRLRWKGDCSAFLLLGLLAICLVPKLWFALPVYGAVLYLLPISPWLRKFLCTKPVLFLGSVSWGVFSFHWPLMCSVGAWMLRMFGYSVPVWLAACSVCVVLTVVLAWVYERIFEKPTQWIQSRAAALLSFGGKN